MQVGKKKLVLDHLIVQKMDDEEDGNIIQSTLTFGAQALFEEQGDQSREITCTFVLSLIIMRKPNQISRLRS